MSKRRGIARVAVSVEPVASGNAAAAPIEARYDGPAFGWAVISTRKEAQRFSRDESDIDDQDSKETLENIADILSGKEWNSDTCSEIASLMREAGYEIAGI